jgi:hypothetical protein
MNDLPGRLARMLDSGEEDPSVLQELRTLDMRDNDVDGVLTVLQGLSPAHPLFEPVITALQEAQGNEAPRPMLNIDDFYRPGDESYELRWPLAPATAAVMPFPWETLDRKTQFFVLFQEWTRRELEATTARNMGDLDGARAAFEECLERADQLDVNELRARSYEDLAAVAADEDDEAAADRWLDAAEAARASA